MRDRPPDDGRGRREDLADGEPAAAPEIEGQRLVRARIAGGGRLDRAQVRVGQVRHVDVVPDARPVRGRVVVAEEGQRQAALGGEQDVRDEMGLGVMVLAQRRRRAGDVEVAERDAAQAVRPAVPGQRRLEAALGLSVRVDRAERGVLGDRRGIGDAVDRRARGEDQPQDTGGAGGLEQCDTAGHVLAEVLRRVGDRFADQRPRGAMEDGLDPLGLEDPGQRVGLDVGADPDGHARGDRGAMPGREVIEDDHVVAGRQEGLGRDRAHIAGAPGHQDPCHARTILLGELEDDLVGAMKEGRPAWRAAPSLWPVGISVALDLAGIPAQVPLEVVVSEADASRGCAGDGHLVRR